MRSTSKPLHIFRAGRHVAMSGAAIAFSESDLEATAQAYDPALWRAPLVVGHPRVDAPAYGWVDGIQFSDIGLEATPGDVEPEFAELVRSKRFSNISASFWSPIAPGNPVPGVFYLRHVGFLGAQPPALKGLRTPEFGDSADGIVEFSEWDDVDNAGLWRRMREWVIAKFGLADADQVVPSYLVDGLERSAQRELDESLAEDPPTAAPLAPAFSDPAQENSVTPEEKARLEAENAELRQRLAASDAAAREQATATRHATHVSFAEGLIGAGKLPPAHKDLIIAVMDFAAAQEQVVEFGEGDAKQPLVDGFKAYLEAQPVDQIFKEFATAERAATNPGVVSFAAPAGYSVSGESAALHAKALAYQKANPGTEYLAALTAVSN